MNSTEIHRSYAARALATAETEGPHHLDYSTGDTIAIIAEYHERPCLGVLSDKNRRKGGRYLLDPDLMLRLPMPTPIQYPDSEFIDGWIPVLFYGEQRILI